MTGCSDAYETNNGGAGVLGVWTTEATVAIGSAGVTLNGCDEDDDEENDDVSDTNEADAIGVGISEPTRAFMPPPATS